MPKPARGEVRWTAEGPVARITLKGKERQSFLLSSCRTEPEAEERAKLLAELAQRFRRAGVLDTPDARKLLETAASCSSKTLPGVLTVAGELVGGELVDASTVPTFSALAKDWTDGKLHRDYPDHVKKKDSELDAARLEKLNAIEVGGMKLGEVPLDRFTLDHAESAMRQLPPEAKRPATRRQYAQIIHRVMALAVYPCRILKASPLPRGFMPKSGKPPATPYLYPSEEAQLMACRAVPIEDRVFFGFLAREGMRAGEAVALSWRDLDLERGAVALDKNKTDDARAWALDPGVTRALRAWRKLRGGGPNALVFTDADGGVYEIDKLAERLRRRLKTAGVERAELHEAGENRGRLRAHDLRGTFVTLSLANGRTEAWVQDRTGHTTSAMLNRYRRAARSATELRVGVLHPLDQAIPELRSPLDCPIALGAGQDAAQQVSEILRQAEVAEPADAADSKSAS